MNIGQLQIADLDPTRRDPLHRQLSSQLRNAVEAGLLSPLTPLPPEVALASALGVSRATVRQAIQELVQEGLLARFRGKGTFVLPEKIEEAGQRLRGFTESMREKGVEPQTRLFGLEVRLADDLAKHFDVDAEAELFRVTRLRSGDGVPLMVENSYLLSSRFPDLFSHDLTGSLYALLNDVYGVSVCSAEETIEAVLSEGMMARWLGIDPGQPLLLVKRRTRDVHGTVVEYAERWAAASRCRVRLDLAMDSPLMEFEPMRGGVPSGRTS